MKAELRKLRKRLLLGHVLGVAILSALTILALSILHGHQINDLLANQLAEQRRTVTTHAADGRPYLVQTGIPREHIQDSVATVRYLSVALVLILAGMLAWWYWRLLDQAVLRVVQTIHSFVHRLSRGRVPQRSGVRPPEAIEHLAADLQHYVEEVEQSQQDFLAAVSHQLRQPLAALRISLELPLRKRSKASEYRTSLKEALEQTDRVIRLTRSLLELAEAENSCLDVQKASLAMLVQEVADDMRLLAEARALRLVVEASGDFSVCANPLRLQQAVLNVIDNAIKYSPGGTTVRVCLSRSDEDACLSICDEGPGVPPEELDRLFQPFYRGQAATETVPGNGLGLAIAKRIVEAAGGGIQVESKVGQGSCFRICLPLVLA